MFNQNPNCGRCGHLNTRGFCNLTACLFPFPANTVIDSYEVKPKTNADRIRAMSDEELAKTLLCIPQGDAGCTNPYEQDCEACILNWLKKEVEDGHIE